MRYLIITIILIASLNQLSAQTIINNSETNNRFYTRIGIEPSTMLTIGYQRNFKVKFLDRDLSTYSEFGLDPYILSFKNSDLKVGGIIPIYEKKNFKLLNNLHLSLGSLSTRNFKSTRFAVGDEVAAGFYKQKWFFATTFEYENIFFTHIKHTKFYRVTYYEDAKNGWYKGTGGMFQFGIEGGATIKNKYDLHCEIKLPFTEKFNGYGGSPFHVNLGLGYRF